MKKKPKALTLEERIKAFALQEQKLLKQHKIAKKSIVVFPTHKKVPLLGRIAGWLLKIAKGKIQTVFIETK